MPQPNFGASFYNPYSDPAFGSRFGNDSQGGDPYNLRKHYSTFTGADIHAHIGARQIGSLESVTYTSTRETAPRYVMGRTDPVAFVKGKRAIAGSLVFSQFDRHAVLYEIFSDITDSKAPGNLSTFWGRNTADIINKRPGAKPDFTIPDETAQFGPFFRTIAQGNMQADLERQNTQLYALTALKRFDYADQIPPFDITITMVNEIGDAATMTIYGISLVNEGGGYTMDDLSSNVAYSFVSLGLSPLQPLTFGGLGGGAASSNQVLRNI